MGDQIVFSIHYTNTQTDILVITNDSIVMWFVAFPFFAHKESSSGFDGFDEVFRTISCFAGIISSSQIFRKQ